MLSLCRIPVTLGTWGEPLISISTTTSLRSRDDEPGAEERIAIQHSTAQYSKLLRCI